MGMSNEQKKDVQCKYYSHDSKTWTLKNLSTGCGLQPICMIP